MAMLPPSSSSSSYASSPLAEGHSSFTKTQDPHHALPEEQHTTSQWDKDCGHGFQRIVSIPYFTVYPPDILACHQPLYYPGCISTNSRASQKRLKQLPLGQTLRTNLHSRRPYGISTSTFHL